MRPRRARRDERGDRARGNLSAPHRRGRAGHEARRGTAADARAAVVRRAWRRPCCRAPRSCRPSRSLPADAFIADDGARLPLREWLPQGKVKATILALHGFNDYSNAFAGPGDGLGQARHRHLRLRPARLRRGARPRRWVGAQRLDEDVAIASRLRRARAIPACRIYLLGESMGGAVAITAATGAAGAPTPGHRRAHPRRRPRCGAAPR